MGRGAKLGRTWKRSLKMLGGKIQGLVTCRSVTRGEKRIRNLTSELLFSEFNG